MTVGLGLVAGVFFDSQGLLTHIPIRLELYPDSQEVTFRIEACIIASLWAGIL